MDLVERSKNILQPNQEWPVIAAEAETTQALLLQYAVPLAAIGPIATWIGLSLVGISVPFAGTMRTPLLAGLAFAVTSFVFALIGVFVTGLIVDALAPTFSGEKNFAQAMKCAVYAYTPLWLAGILHIIPALGTLALLAGLYGLYLLYLALPVLMKAPKEKALGYTAVVVLSSIVLSIVFGSVAAMFTLSSRGIGAVGPGILQGRPELRPAPDSALGKLDALSKQLDASNKKMEDANKKGDVAGSVSAAMEGLSSMAAGGRKVTPVPVDQLQSLLPSSLDGMQRSELSSEQNSFGGMSVTMVNATYRDGSSRDVKIGVGDLGAAGALFALTSMMGAGSSKETEAGYEKMGKVDGRLVIEKKDKRSGANEYGLVLADRFVVNTSSPQMDPSQLKALVGKLDLAKLESMKDIGVQK